MHSGIWRSATNSRRLNPRPLGDRRRRAWAVIGQLDFTRSHLATHEAVNGRQSAHDAGPPYVLEADGAQFGIAGCVLDGPVPQPILDQPRVMARVGHSIAAGIAEHVGMNLEGEVSSLADALDEAVERPTSKGGRIPCRLPMSPGTNADAGNVATGPGQRAHEPPGDQITGLN
jgi:hypothetical protein